MLSNVRIKLINQLKQKKQRELHNMFIAEGDINVLDFIKSETKLIELFATQSWLEKNEHLINENLVTLVSTKELKKVSALSSPSDVLAIFNRQKHEFSNNLDVNNICIACDNISDPGNLGTIIRTADWFGINNIYCSKNTVDATNPKVVQATMGSLARVKVHYINLELAFKNKPKDLSIFGAVLNGTPLTEISPQKNGVILIGSEAHGISNDLLPYITHKITIPLHRKNISNTIESLNASVANAIICYALVK